MSATNLIVQGHARLTPIEGGFHRAVTMAQQVCARDATRTKRHHMHFEPIVFVVDDDSFTRELLQQVFDDAGMRVQAFPSAADLLARADLDAPCVVLLDVRMPGMSGPELQTLLRARGLSLPIIFLTGSSDLAAAVTAMRNGAVDYLTKPFDSATLVDRVRQAFARFHAPERPPPVFEYSRRLVTLTPREAEVYELMLTGMSSKHIARALDCSFRTVDIHRGRVMTKMAASNLVQLVRMNVEQQAMT